MAEAPFVIRYEFRYPPEGGVSFPPTAFTITLDPKTLVNAEPPPTDAPDWARLEFEQCPRCPLAGTTFCPVAARLSGLVAEFAHVSSHSRVAVRVTVPERTYAKDDVPVQEALSSLLGVFMTTSGCPVLGRLKTMVRFHLPFATELETVTRATSMYLFGQYLASQHGRTPDWTLSGLADTYRETQQVNRAFARRLRAAAPRDANVNALVRLDSMARSLPELIEDRMEELRYLFET